MLPASFLLSGFIIGGDDDSTALVLTFGLFSFALVLQAQSTRLNAMAAKRSHVLVSVDGAGDYAERRATPQT